jgi:hypothetical protein
MTTQPAAFSDRQRQGISKLVHNARAFERRRDATVDDLQDTLQACAWAAAAHDLPQADAVFLAQALMPLSVAPLVGPVFADVYSRA